MMGCKLYTDLAATIEAKPGDKVAVIIQDGLPTFMQEKPKNRPILTTPQPIRRPSWGARFWEQDDNR